MGNIASKITAIRREINYIQKDKKVGSDGGYMAVTHDQVTAQVRGLLVKHGVVVIPSVCGIPATVDTGTKTAKGIPFIRFEALFNVRFLSDDDESYIDMMMAAHAIDQGDKAPGKAISYATKYALLKILNIETGEDEEGREVQHVIGMPQETFSGWMNQISMVKPGEDVKPLWKQILADCKTYDDTAAMTRLKAALTEKAAPDAGTSKQ